MPRDAAYYRTASLDDVLNVASWEPSAEEVALAKAREAHADDDEDWALDVRDEVL